MSRSTEPRFVVELETEDGLARLIDAPMGPGSVVGDAGGFRALLDARPIESRRPRGRARSDARGVRATGRRGRPSRDRAQPGSRSVLLIPGVLYAENRPDGSTLPYPAWRLDPDPADDAVTDASPR